MNEKVKKAFNILDHAVDLIRTSPKSWKSYLSFTAGIYKYGFSDSLLIYVHRPDATACATLELWNKLGRRIKAGARGIPLIDDSTENIRLKYIYDINDTTGPESTLPKIWSLRKDNQRQIYDFISSSLNIRSPIPFSTGDLPAYFRNLAAEYAYKELKKDNPHLTGEGQQDFIITLSESVAFLVCSRCGINAGDFSFDTFKSIAWDVYTVKKLGALVHKYSYGILKLIEGKVKELDNDLAQEPDVVPVDRKENFKRDSNFQTYTQLGLDDIYKSKGTNIIKQEDIGGMSHDSDRNHQIEQTWHNGEKPYADLQTADVRNTGEGRDIVRSALPDAGANSRDPEIGERTTEESHSSTENRKLHGELAVQSMAGGHSLGNGEGQDPAARGTGNEKLKNGQYPEGAIKVEKPDSSFFDNPVRAANSLSNYSEAIELARTKDFKGVNQWVLDNEVELAQLVYQNESAEFILCDHAGEIVSDILKKAGVLHTVEVGIIQNEGHMWVRVGRDNIIDPTVSQFGRYLKVEDYDNAADLSIHRYDMPEDKEAHIYNTKNHVNPKKPGGINFRITPEDNIGSGGLKTKYKDNIAAIKLLKLIEEEGRLAAPDEQKILARYVGWGGMPQVFSYLEDTGEWNKERDELKSLLEEDEYNSARNSTVNAHYTSPEVIAATYEGLKRMGFKGGTILEPAMGIGNFFGMLPEEMQNSRLVGVELDDITGRIAKQLYQNADIRIQGFEEALLPENFFDVAISNVPFGEYHVHDPKLNQYKFFIHDYFFAKALEKVRPGGIIAFITSKGTLDKANNTTRKYLAQRADLLGAIRLPNNAFKANANTEVTTDIIFLQKRDRLVDQEADWMYTCLTDDGVPVNEYYLQNPQMLLGKMVFDESMYGSSKDTALHPDGRKLSEALSEAVGLLPENILKKSAELVEELENGEDILPANPDVKDYAFTIVDDKLYQRTGSDMIPVRQEGKVAERIRGLIQVRDVAREILHVQLEDYPEHFIKEAQRKLNNLYDQFVKGNGIINSRANELAFGDDPDFPLLCSL